MKELFEAIYSRFLADLSTSGLKDLYNTEAPQEAEFPYGVFSLVSNTQDFTFTENSENCLIQFNLFSEESSSQEVCNLYKLLKESFDFLELSLDSYITTSMRREVATLIREEKVWQYNVSYRIILQKT